MKTLTQLANSPQGKKLVDRAQQFANDPKTREQVEKAKLKLAEIRSGGSTGGTTRGPGGGTTGGPGSGPSGGTTGGPGSGPSGGASGSDDGPKVA
jgi:hypothetical protein